MPQTAQEPESGTDKTVSDGALLARYLAGPGASSEAAFALLGKRYGRLVYATCVRELHQPALAEDAAQEVFLLLAQKAPGLTNSISLAGWLFTSARLVSSNVRRQEVRRQEREEQAVRENEQSAKNAANDLIRWEEIEPHLNEALARLKPRERDALLIRFFDGASLAETGQQLGIGENAARMRVSRALDHTRALLRQVSVVVPVVALVALLEAESAKAAPLAVMEGIAQIASAPVGTLASAPSLASVTASGASVVLTSLKIAAVILGVGAAGWGGAQYVRHYQTATRRVIPAALAPLVGRWRGTLVYRDYQSDQLVTLQTRWTVTPSAPDAGVLDVVQAYPGSRTDSEQITFDSDGQYQETDQEDATYVSAVQGGGAALHDWSNGTSSTLVLLRDGTDGNLPSHIRQTYTRTGFTKMTLLKEVQPFTAKTWQFRNRYTLSRE